MTKSNGYVNIIGKSPEMKLVSELIARVSLAKASVLIRGESGTGKELIARAIHESGPRAGLPFVAINCSAIPETLLESELFGHARGSFTGATQDKLGLFEEAQGGTVFLDEIGDMNILMQSKLLRVLQERKIRPVGVNTTREIDVRIISATHMNLREAIQEGRFREDLFYRLNVIQISVPALRDRKDDIPLLADFFLNKYAAENQSCAKGFTKRALSKMLSQKWEGNVRELENTIERMVILTTNPLIDEADFDILASHDPESLDSKMTSDWPTLTQLEERYVERVLHRVGGRKDKASEVLGINRRTLYRKEREIKLFGLSPTGAYENGAIQH